MSPLCRSYLRIPYAKSSVKINDLKEKTEGAADAGTISLLPSEWGENREVSSTMDIVSQVGALSLPQSLLSLLAVNPGPNVNQTAAMMQCR
jgi:hypothetical protein